MQSSRKNNFRKTRKNSSKKRYISKSRVSIKQKGGAPEWEYLEQLIKFNRQSSIPYPLTDQDLKNP